MANRGSAFVVDLFCGAGGASVGIARCGFEVFGVDINTQPSYPFPMIKADVLDVIKILLDGGSVPVGGRCLSLSDIAWLWASPPCQCYSWAAKRWKNIERVDLVAPVRALLHETGKLYVIENVLGAPLLNPMSISGPQVGLVPRNGIPGVIRRRFFESNILLVPPPPVRMPRGQVRTGAYVTVAGHGGNGRAGTSLWRAAMDVPWMTARQRETGTRSDPGNREDIAESVPPAYSEFIARQVAEACLDTCIGDGASRRAFVGKAGDTWPARDRSSPIQLDVLEPASPLSRQQRYDNSQRR